MNTSLRNGILSVMGVVALSLLYIIYSAPNNKLATSGQEQLASVFTASENNVQLQLDQRTKSSDCIISGALPDHTCTPGAVFAQATVDQICVVGYTKTVRKVSENLHKKVFAEYSIPYPQPFGSYEVDHVIPLALGGSNDIANLFPEAKEPAPGFPEKDVVENYLHDQVCQGKLPLSLAQQKIATDWLAIYKALDPLIIQEIKSRYKSWAQ